MDQTPKTTPNGPERRSSAIRPTACSAGRSSCLAACGDRRSGTRGESWFALSRRPMNGSASGHWDHRILSRRHFAALILSLRPPMLSRIAADNH